MDTEIINKIDTHSLQGFPKYIKGLVHLNIIFSYMKVNKICNLDHPVY